MKISYSQVEAYCNELHNLAKKMDNILSNVKSIGQVAIKNQDWQGKAANYYSQKLNNVIQNFDEVYREIENSILYMAKCSEGYQAVDKQIIDEICNKLGITTPSLDTSNIFN